MSTIKPQTTSEEISDKLRLLALSGGHYSTVEASKVEILAECERLAKADVVAASFLKSNLYALLGDKSSMEYWIRNATRNGADGLEAMHSNLGLMGYVSESYSTLQILVDTCPSLHLARITASHGLFRCAEKVLSKVNPDEVEPNLISVIAQGRACQDALGLPDEVVCRTMDIVIGILRENGLIWIDLLPDIRTQTIEDIGPILSMFYKIDSTPQKAADLNHTLIEQLVAADLDSSGLVVGYQGVAVDGVVKTIA